MPNRTLFSFEVPIANLEEFREDQDFHFALSFLLGDKVYSDYFSSLTGDWILDNSFNEMQKPETPEHMVKYYLDYNPWWIISPDSDQWGISQVCNAFEDMTVIIPPERVIGIFKSAQEYKALASIGCTRFASSYAHRPLMPEWLLKMPHHFLGSLGPLEVNLLKPYSCDTSMPIKLAIEDILVDQWVLEGCPHILSRPKFFYTPLTLKQMKLAKNNIRRFREICNQ